ncbi:MAG: DUF411 domain-containing protein [Campylobacterales bacterium]|nr:DUF411 domain-containing protein [Campylobacterales bacterium]
MKKVLLIFTLFTVTLLAENHMTVYKSKYCGCCGKWVEHMEKNGYKVKTIIREDMTSVKQELGVPMNLQSCHTAIVNGYLVEGHVPADVVDKMLKEKPKIKGIASPGMPMGSPGMEQENMKDPNPIYAFDKSKKPYLFAKR